jgi:nicotinamide phosphoribosyltransferase
MTISAASMQKDVYKEFHVHAYHPDVTEVYSNFTSRSGKWSNIEDNDTVNFVGLQYFIMDYLIEEWKESFFSLPLDVAVGRHKRILSAMLGYPVNVQYLIDLHELGYLPLEIKALTEGTAVPYQVAPITFRNTLPGFQWLPNMIETVFSCENWMMQTTSTTSTAYFKAFKEAFVKTGGPMEILPFMCHDFSMRGMTSRHTAAMSGFAHLTSGFAGTDTIPAVLFAEKYYGADVDTELVGASVNATEHSVTCSWMEEGEEAFLDYLMEYPAEKGILSVVADTWDFWEFVTVLLPAMKDKIMARDGQVVVRPDSGDPVDMICGTASPLDFGSLREAVKYFYDEVLDQTPHGDGGEYEVSRKCLIQGEPSFVKFDIEWNRHDKQFYYAEDWCNVKSGPCEFSPEEKGLIECLWDTFGGTVTYEGYKMLDSHIGAIYGDAITLGRQREILDKLIAKGFVPSIVLGVGSYSFQGVTRDTHGSAVKATNVLKNGVDVPIFKDPKTDRSKKSAKGLLSVHCDDDGKLYMLDEQTREQEKGGLLETVFKDGVMLRTTTLAEIRAVVAFDNYS